MDKREAVTIRPTANGYIVDAARRDGEIIAPDTVMVFESMERLTAWIAVHFSRAEPVKAPEADRCAHDWRPSLGKTPEMYCHKCGERKPA